MRAQFMASPQATMTGTLSAWRLFPLPSTGIESGKWEIPIDSTEFEATLRFTLTTCKQPNDGPAHMYKNDIGGLQLIYIDNNDLLVKKHSYDGGVNKEGASLQMSNASSLWQPSMTDLWKMTDEASVGLADTVMQAFVKNQLEAVDSALKVLFHSSPSSAACAGLVTDWIMPKGDSIWSPPPMPPSPPSPPSPPPSLPAAAPKQQLEGV